MAIWSTIIRSILLRGNLLAGDETALAGDYSQTFFTDVDITSSRAEYSFLAMTDSILQAMEKLIAEIGKNRESEHRSWFLDVSAPMVSGDKIPLYATGSTTKQRYGVISDVRDSFNDTYCTEQPKQMIEIANRASPRRNLDLYQFFTDDIRVWHTRPLALAEFVAWDLAAERSAIINSNDTAVCPLPESLLPDLEAGSLAKIFKDTFNREQSKEQLDLFMLALSEIANKPMAAPELAAKL